MTVRKTGLIEKLVVSGLAVHVALTILDNLPDGNRPLAFRIKELGPLPQWRFFAPNPGIDDYHLFYRTSSQTKWSGWVKIEMANRLGAFSWLWNPHGRPPKVLFDAVQQMLVPMASGAAYDWVKTSEPHDALLEIVSDIVKRDASGEKFQFMIVSSRPNASEDEVKPLLVSEEHQIAETVSS